MPPDITSIEECSIEPIASSPPNEDEARACRASQTLSDLELAQDCRTEPEWLSRASRSIDPVVLAAIARNPNTPKPVLFRLWAKFPEAVIENPVLTLWEFTSNGPLMAGIRREVIVSLYEAFLKTTGLVFPDTLLPVDWRIDFLKKWPHQSNLPLHYFLRDPSENVRLVFLEHTLPSKIGHAGSESFPIESLENLLTDASPPIWKAFLFAVTNKWIGPQTENLSFWHETARRLHSFRWRGVNASLSRWESLPVDLIEAISVRAKPATLANLAALPNCPRSMHERFSTNDFEEVRAAVARFTPFPDLHDRFLSDPSFKVRAGLAASQHIVDDIQRRLIFPKNADIHLSLLNNPRALPEVLKILSELPNVDIKSKLLVHPNLPRDVFDEFIALGPKHGIYQGQLASKRELLTPELYYRHKHSFDICVLVAYASLPHTPVEILAELACHPELEIRKAVDQLIYHRETRSRLISDDDAIMIIEAVLNHPDTTDTHPLLRSSSMSMAQAIRIFETPHFNDELRYASVLDRLKLYRRESCYVEYAELYRKIAAPLEPMLAHFSQRNLRWITSYNEVPTKIRELLMNHPDSEVRVSTRKHSRPIPLGAIIDAYPEAFRPNEIPCVNATPREILEKLSYSSHTLLAVNAQRCLAEPQSTWEKSVGKYPKSSG